MFTEEGVFAVKMIDPTATVTVSIPNGHTLAKGPTVAMGMLSNHADLLH